MKSKIGSAYACLVTAVCLLLAACGGSGGAPATPSSSVPASPETGASTTGFPVTIENCGRALTFDKPPSRAVLPIHSIAEIFVGLGLADKAIGRVKSSSGSASRILPDQAASSP